MIEKNHCHIYYHYGQHGHILDLVQHAYLNPTVRLKQITSLEED